MTTRTATNKMMKSMRHTHTQENLLPHSKQCVRQQCLMWRYDSTTSSQWLLLKLYCQKPILGFKWHNLLPEPLVQWGLPCLLGIREDEQAGILKKRLGSNTKQRNNLCKKYHLTYIPHVNTIKKPTKLDKEKNSRNQWPGQTVNGKNYWRIPIHSRSQTSRSFWEFI